MTSGIVRRGDRLLRPMGPWSPAVHKYLRHLEAAGFAGSPRVLRTQSTREVLTFIDGHVAVDRHWQPGARPPAAALCPDRCRLRGAAKLIRQLHCAAAGFWPVITSYRFGPRPPQPGGGHLPRRSWPWNTVYRGEVPVAFIDWDSAGPVDPLADLAAAAWSFVPLAPPGQLAEAGFDPVPDRAARLRTFAAAYGPPDRTAILPELQRCTLDEPEPLGWFRGIAADLARAL